MKIGSRLTQYFFLFASIICIDRITKYLVLLYNPDYEISSFFSISPLFNPGISWGMLQSDNLMHVTVLTVVIGIIVLLVLWHAIVRLQDGVSILPENMILAGAVSNMYDRIFYGAVLDFFKFSYGERTFPVFNVADMAIVVGVAFMIVRMMREEMR